MFLGLTMKTEIIIFGEDILQSCTEKINCRMQEKETAIITRFQQSTVYKS